MALGRRSLARGFDRASDAVTRWMRAWSSYVLPAFFGAIAVGSTIFYLRGKDRIRILGTNSTTFKQQLEAFWGVAAALVALLVAVVFGILWRRRKVGHFDAARVVRAIGSWLLPFGAVPFVLALFQADVEKKTPFLTLFFCLLSAGFVAWGVYRISPPPRPEPEPGEPVGALRRAQAAAGKYAAAAATLAMAAAYGWFFTRLSITNHHALVSRTIDLGLYDNIFYQSIHGRPLACTFMKAEYHGSAHFDPILVLLSPLYLFYPRAELILGLQSVWIASGAVPVYLLAKSQLESRVQAVMMAAVYLLHPAIHGANMYEFHSLTLAPMPMMWTLYFLFTGRKRLYWIALAAALLVREDIPLMMMMMGATTAMFFESKRRQGVLTMIVCIVYFVVVKVFFMTSAGVIMSGPTAYSYGYYYQELIQGGKGLGSMVLSVLTNPAFVVTQVFEEPKMLFVATIFLPMLFLPFAAKGARLMLLYGLAFTLLASRGPVFSTAFQYTSSILPFAFALAPMAIKQVSEGPLAGLYGLHATRLRRALVVGCLVASAGVSYKFGGIFENKTFRGGFYPVVRKLTPQQAELYEFVDKAATSIPKDKSVGVSNKLGPHVSNRRKVYFYGQRPVEYVFVDEAELKKDRKDQHKRDIDSGKLVELMRKGTYALFEVRTGKPKESDTTGDVPDDVLGDDPHDKD